MKKMVMLIAFAVLFNSAQLRAADDKATPQDVYNLVLQAYEVVKALGEESLSAFNDPKGEFIYKDTYILIQQCPSKMVAHPFALDKLKDVDLDKTYTWNRKFCDLGERPGGGWGDYEWPKPGQTELARKITFALRVEGTPYTVMAGIYSDTANVDELNTSLK